jgi:hypothetical protein
LLLDLAFEAWLQVITIVLLLIFAVIFSVPGLRAFFQLVMISPILILAIAALTALWVVAQRFIWSSHWLEHFLDMD